ncbi:endolytic transglycosylase MltG [Candidatus Nomurabacteria bacterium]|nr:endolytic transglycosylase MltG [Candidatus Nomurabacteria bacterium]
MNDIQPRRKPVKRPTQKIDKPATPAAVSASDIDSHTEILNSDQAARQVDTRSSNDFKKTKRPWKRYAAGLFLLVVLVVISVMLWYQDGISAVEPGSGEQVAVTIDPGMDVDAIAAKLNQSKLLKSETAFKWYVKLNGESGKLQAGSFRIKKSDNVSEIVKQLKSGKADTFNVTFLPGATVSDNKKVLAKLGFEKSEIDAAFSKQYKSPLFDGKPATADLEGYIYGETYNFVADTSVEQILERTFREYEKIIREGNLKDAYKKQGLSLYEGITLASIVQREVPTAGDQQVVAGIFYNRLSADMNLGSDVTYQYIADKTGQDRDPNLDSPYNTRRYSGLPPGPIASPGKSSLLAVANPTKSDYLFFLSGDDDKTYFGKTNAEHQHNIDKYCQKKCLIL